MESLIFVWPLRFQQDGVGQRADHKFYDRNDRKQEHTYYVALTHFITCSHSFFFYFSFWWLRIRPVVGGHTSSWLEQSSSPLSCVRSFCGLWLVNSLSFGMSSNYSSAAKFRVGRENREPERNKTTISRWLLAASVDTDNMSLTYRAKPRLDVHHRVA